MLGGVSVMTLIRLEWKGALKPVRLNPRSKAGMVFYRHDDLLAMAQARDGMHD